MSFLKSAVSRLLSSLFVLLLASLVARPALAEVETKDLTYKIDGKEYEGYLATPKDLKKEAPLVLVVHAWKGLGDYEKMRSQQLAELGYIAFAVDVYGKGARPNNAEEAQKLSSALKQNRKLLRKRLQAGYEFAKKQSHVDLSKTAAIGYCFGGGSVLELARSGAKLKGFVSFHGNLDTPTPKDAKNIKGRVLALHGGADPYVTAADVQAFTEEMNTAKVDWELISYGNAVHAFTEKASGNDPSKGVAYNEKADKRSWKAMQEFFKELF